MTKYLYAGSAADYPTLGFAVAGDGSILDGSLSSPAITTPPDARWSVYGGGSAETGINRYASPSGSTSPTEPTDGSLLRYSDAANSYVASSPADVATVLTSSLAAAFVPRWAASTAYATDALAIAPTGQTIKRTASGTSRPSYDATEAALWTVIGSATLARTAVKTASYTASAGDLVPVDTTSSAVTVTLPNAPADKTQVAVKYVIASGKTLTVACAGIDTFNRASGSTTMTFSILGQGAIYQYDASTKVWTVMEFAPPISTLDARFASAGSLDRFHRQLATDPANTKIALLGDSTSLAANISALLGALQEECKPGGILAGMSTSNIQAYGNNGVRLDTFLTHESTGVGAGVGTGTTDWATFAAFGPHLAITSWGLNDARDNSTGPLTTTAAQLKTRLDSLVALFKRDLPNTDVILRKPNTVATGGGGAYYVGTRTAAEVNGITAGAYGAMEGLYPHVQVYDPVRVFGSGTQATSPMLQDQLHPGPLGQRALARDMLRLIAPAAAAAPQQLGPAAEYMRFGQVTALGTNFIEIRSLNYSGSGGVSVMEVNAPEWVIDQSTGVLYGPLGSRAMTTSGKASSGSSLSLRIQDNVGGGFDFSTVAAVGSIVQLNATGFSSEGANSGAIIAQVDPPSMAASAFGTATATVTGARAGHGVVYAPPVGFFSQGISVLGAWVTANDTVSFRFQNLTGSTIDYGAGNWNFWLLR